MYQNQEKQFGMVLKHSDFDWDFLCWASRYLESSIDSILESFQFLVRVINDEHRRRRSEQETRRQGDASSKALLQGLERSINLRKNLNRIDLHMRVRGVQIPIPYLPEDGDILRRQGYLNIILKVNFAENQPPSALCAPNAQCCDPAHCMRIKCTYVHKKQEEMHWRGVVGNSGTENTDPYANVSDELSGGPREGRGLTIYFITATSIQF